MTKKEQQACNKFLMSMLKNKQRRFVDAKVFDKRSNGQLIVLPVKTILKEWKKFREAVEK